MKLHKGHRYKPATGAKVKAFEPTTGWADLTSDFVCTGEPVAKPKIKGYDGKSAEATPIEVGSSNTTRYLDAADVADAANWDLPDRPIKGTSDVADPVGAGKLDHVAAYVTPWDVAHEGKQGADGGRMVGFRDPTLGWRTEVTWGPLTQGFKVPEGTWMKADRLGPDHPRGGDTDDLTRTNSKAIEEEHGGKWIAGHLLNDWLGGSGHEPKNLVAIPHEANAQMSSFEEKVKAEVNDRGRWVTYHVTTTHDPKTRVANKIEMMYQLLAKDGSGTGEKHERTISVPALDGKASAKDAPATGAVEANVQESEIRKGHPFAAPLESERASTQANWPREFPYNASLQQGEVDRFLDQTFKGEKLMLRTGSLAIEANKDGFALDERKRQPGEFEVTEQKDKKKAGKGVKKRTRKDEIAHLKEHARTQITHDAPDSETNQYYKGYYLDASLAGKTLAANKQRAVGVDDQVAKKLKTEPFFKTFETADAHHHDVGRAEAEQAYLTAGHDQAAFGEVWAAFRHVVGRLPEPGFQDFLDGLYAEFLKKGEKDLGAWLDTRLMST